MLRFGLFLCLVVVASVVNAMQVSLNVSNKPYAITFDENNFTILGLAEKFCRNLAEEFNLRTMEDLLISCVTPIAVEFRREIGKSLDASKISQGDLSSESAAWVASANAAIARAAAERSAPAAPPAPVASAQFPTDFRVQVSAGQQQFVIVIDLNRFTLTSAAEQFCRQRRQELSITTYEALVDECVPQVAGIIRSELAKTYNPDSIPVGELSEDSKVGIANARAAAQRRAQEQQAQAQTAAVQANGNVEAPRQLRIQITANSNPYVIVADLKSFTLLTTAEQFCRQKAAELGVTSMESLILRCIPSIANYIKDELSVEFNPATIPEGDLSPDAATWFNNYRNQQRALQAEQTAAAAAAAAAQQAAAQQAAAQQAPTQQAAASRTAFEIAVPIDGVDYTVSFDTRRATPMSVAEALCSQEALGIRTLDVLVNTCLPQVSNYIRQTVNRAIAPDTIAVGEYSAQLRTLIENVSRQ